MRVRAIFYDFDGTLRMDVPQSIDAFMGVARALGVETGPADFARLARWEHAYLAQSAELRADEMAFPTKRDYRTNFCRRRLLALGAAADRAATLAPGAYERMADNYRPEDTIPEDLLETLRTLKETGYFLGVLSNRKKPITDYLSELGLGKFFDLAICAGEAGIYKPDPGAFHYLLDKARISARESVYVGDNYYADVVGARLAGMTPVLFDLRNIFCEADCAVIQAHNQILSWIARRMAYKSDREIYGLPYDNSL
jgi:HAD superfamily hydrolase (TIGR01662 family)